ncbi:HD domain-containing protein [Patescibacteria group bacterium]|nr:HD domain-containing protein [Patescibacteria group bacterium]MCL5091842.1 HD domain-containing protein [Patescibacteria group bacterium]
MKVERGLIRSDYDWSLNLLRQLGRHHLPTLQHSFRTAQLMGRLTEQAEGTCPVFNELLRRYPRPDVVKLALFHDIGKIFVTDSILARTNNHLTHKDKALLHQHVPVGAAICNGFTGFPFPQRYFALMHHADRNATLGLNYLRQTDFPAYLLLQGLETIDWLAAVVDPARAYNGQVPLEAAVRQIQSAFRNTSLENDPRRIDPLWQAPFTAMINSGVDPARLPVPNNVDDIDSHWSRLVNRFG